MEFVEKTSKKEVIEEHQHNDRGIQIAFLQGSSERKQKNQDLIDYETSYHKTYAEAVLCIMVSHSCSFVNIFKQGRRNRGVPGVQVHK